MNLRTLTHYLLDAGVNPSVIADVLRVYQSMLPVDAIISCEVK